MRPLVLALYLQHPADGLPLLQDWLTTAGDIYHTGFEGWRETIEVRCNSTCLGRPIEYGSLRPTKGVGRASVIMFAILYTFHELKNKLSKEETDDFARLNSGATCCKDCSRCLSSSLCGRT